MAALQRLKLHPSDADVMISGSKLGRITLETTKTNDKLAAESAALADVQNKINSLLHMKDELNARLVALQMSFDTQKHTKPSGDISKPLMYQSIPEPRTSRAMSEEKSAVLVYNDLNAEEPSKGIIVTPQMSKQEIIETTMRKFRIEGSADDFVFLEVTEKGERVVEENLLVAKNALDRGDHKIAKFFITKKLNDGHLKVTVEGEGEKSFPTTVKTTTEELIASAGKKGDKWKLFLVEGPKEQALAPTDLPFDLYSRRVRRGDAPGIKLVLRDTATPVQAFAGRLKALPNVPKPVPSVLHTPQDLQAFKEDPENSYCADCNASDPDHVSLNLGIYLCRDCARIHTALSGTQTTNDSVFVSKIRPCFYFNWPPEMSQIVKQIGNGNANKHWEKTLAKSGTMKAASIDSEEEKASYIRRKYIDQEFVSLSQQDTVQKLVNAVQAKDLLSVYQGLMSSMEYKDYANAEGKTLLHLAVSSGHLPTVILMICVGLDPLITDVGQRTSLYFAAQLKRDDLMFAIKNAQSIYEASVRNTRRIDAATGVSKLGDEEFRRLYLDVMNEVDRRVTGEGDAAAPGGQKLAKLEQADFTALASTVFEEQNQREYFNVYSSHPAPNSDANWVDNLKKRQDAESNLGVYRPPVANQSARGTSSQFFIAGNNPSIVPASADTSPPTSPVETKKPSFSMKASVKQAIVPPPLKPEVVHEPAKKAVEPWRAEAERREAQEKLTFEKLQREKEEMERVARERIKQKAEEKAREEEEKRRAEERKVREQQEKAQEIDDLDFLLEESMKQTEMLDLEADEEVKKVMLLREEEERRKKAEREKIEAEIRVKQEAMKKKQEEERQIAAAKRAEQDRINAEKRVEEERLNAIELKRMQEEQRHFLEEMEREEKRQKELKAKQDAEQTAQSLQEIMEATMRIDQEKKAKQDRAEENRKKRAAEAKDRHEAKLRELTEHAVSTVKSFVTVTNSDKPGTFYEYFVPVATSSHALAVYADEIVADSDFEESKKHEISMTAERLMTKMKELMEAVKIAARLFPAEEPLATMRTKAFDLVKTVKELVLAVK